MIAATQKRIMAEIRANLAPIFGFSTEDASLEQVLGTRQELWQFERAVVAAHRLYLLQKQRRHIV